MGPPIIFIHYGDSSYLKYTLRAAVAFNPDKTVILLGDKTNAHVSDIGIEHHKFEDYSSGEEVELFDKVFQHTAGEFHGRRQWTRFVFRRWFLIYNFLQARGIQKFWTFDSDTLILTRLAAQESKFFEFDCTEQCAELCLNGFVSNRQVVLGYVQKINELFQQEDFLEQQRIKLRSLPRYAFTEMGAYALYRSSSKIKRISLNEIIHGETFCDSVCTLEEHKVQCADQYAKYDKKIWGFEMKKMYVSGDGEIFMFHVPSKQFVKLNTINLSWVPDCLFELLMEISMLKLSGTVKSDGAKRELRVLDPMGECARMGIPAVDQKLEPRRGFPVTEKLLEKLRQLRTKDPNIYPLW